MRYTDDEKGDLVAAAKQRLQEITCSKLVTACWLCKKYSANRDDCLLCPANKLPGDLCAKFLDLSSEDRIIGNYTKTKKFLQGIICRHDIKIKGDKENG